MQKPITSYFNKQTKKAKYDDDDLNNEVEHLTIFSNVSIDMYDNNLIPDYNDINYINKLKDCRYECKF